MLCRPIVGYVASTDRRFRSHAYAAAAPGDADFLRVSPFVTMTKGPALAARRPRQPGTRSRCSVLARDEFRMMVLECSL